MDVVQAPKKIQSKNYLKTGQFPIIDQGQSDIVGYTDDKSTLLPAGEYVLFGDHTLSIKYVDFKFAQGADGLKILRAKPNISTRYLYHCCLQFKIPSRGYSRHWTYMKEVKFPIPPLPVQEEIARILDTFTGLEAELEAELEARKKQNEYYRARLLTLNKPTGFNHIDQLIKDLCPNGVTFKKLKDVCIIKKGTQLNKDKLKDEGAYPVINGGISPSGYWDEFNFSANLITISQGGASAGFVNFIETPFWAGAHCYVISKWIDSIDYRYLYHFVKQQQKTFQQKKVGAGIPGLALKEVNELLIPVPPLAVQKEIVQVLDAFTELEAELEAELAGRRKQYEYYRDKLLTFKELKA